MRLRLEPALKPKVCVLGGSGFVGRHLLSLLSEEGYRMRVPTRRASRHRDLKVLPGVELVEADIHNTTELRGVLHDCGVVVNLVAILNEARRGDFEAVHVKLPRNLVHVCQELGLRRLLHVSALNADAERGPSRYLATKGQGEELVAAAEDLEVTVFRPSIIFGPDDHFFNRFARLLKWSPLVFPLAGADSRFAPVFVGDVAQAMLISMEDSETIGRRYELCGPNVYTLRQLVDFTASTLGLHRRVVGLGQGLSRLQAAVAGHLPGKPFTYDNLLSLQVDAVCNGRFPEIFGIEPSSIESLVPVYLRHVNQRNRFDEYRRRARHDY